VEYYIYLKASSYLADFIKNAYGDPVCLDKDSPEARIIREFISKTPEGQPPDTGEDANLKIRIPFFKEADPRVYNYLGKNAKQLLLESFDQIIERSLLNEIGSLDSNLKGKISAKIYAWMEKHGVRDNGTNWYAVSQKYYRLRKRIVRNCKQIQSKS
jgi:hypothetical protein